MRVLQLGKFYPIRGGVEKVMWDLTKGLNAKGVDCDMLCAALSPCKPDPDDGPAVVEESPLTFGMGGNGRCICVRARAKKAATMIAPAMIKWLRRHKDDYDIIHVHHPDPMACLALRCSGFKGKVVLHWHSDILKQKAILLFYKPLQSWLIRRADRIAGTTPVYVAQSPYLKDVQDKLHIIPIGIEDNVRKPGHCDRGDERLVFSLGRLVPYKGFSYLIQAAKLLPDNYRVVIGGMGPLKEDLQAEIDAAELGNKVVLAGYLSTEQVRSLYNECTLFCLSSVMKTEAFGIVQLEAMSCGKPVVATRIPASGVAWVNEEGVSGLNVEPRDARALADAIVAVCEDPVRYAQFCEGARKRFEQNFTFDAMIGNAAALYNELLCHEN